MAFFACPSPLHSLMRGPLGLISVLGRGSGLSDSLTRSLSGGGGAVPFFSKGLFSVQYSLWFFGIELVCGLLPAQQSFLGFSNSPEVCPVKPHGPSCRGIPPAALPQVRKEPDVWSHCPSSPAPSQGQLCASQLWAETIPITGLCLWVLSLLFLIFKKERQHG